MSYFSFMGIKQYWSYTGGALLAKGYERREAGVETKARPLDTALGTAMGSFGVDAHSVKFMLFSGGSQAFCGLARLG